MVVFGRRNQQRIRFPDRRTKIHHALRNGGGFDVVRATGRDVHSIYFEAPAEHGYVGLVIFLALGIGAYLTAGSTIRRARDHPELAWAVDLAAMVQVSIAAYAIAGAFLTLATFDLYYHLIAIVVVASALVRARLAAGVPVGATTVAWALR